MRDGHGGQGISNAKIKLCVLRRTPKIKRDKRDKGWRLGAGRLAMAVLAIFVSHF